MPPLFSVIIPARNAGKTLPICLSSIAAMQAPAGGYEIIVVDDGSTDDTAACAAQFGAAVISRRHRCVAAVRNTGAAKARGKILAFLDSDVKVDPRWLSHAEKHYYGQGWGGVLSYADHASVEAGWIGRLWNDPLRRAAFQGEAADFMPTRNLFVPVELHRSIDGFDEKLFDGHRTGEDKDYTWRLARTGATLFCDETLDMLHLGWERNLAELLRKERWRQGSTLLMAAHNGWNRRLLRTPLIAVIHAVSLLCTLTGIVFAFFQLTPAIALVAAGGVMWVLPSLAQTVRDSAGQLKTSKLLGVWMISLFRWTAAATTLPNQIVVLLGRRLR
jgi:glycosyltransferase involved in cell wall biosynthesis